MTFRLRALLRSWFLIVSSKECDPQLAREGEINCTSSTINFAPISSVGLIRQPYLVAALARRQVLHLPRLNPDPRDHAGEH